MICPCFPVIGVNAFILAQDIQLKGQDYTVSTITGQIIILITTILGFIYTVYRENRNRRWDLEDRERARKELADKLEIQHAKVADKVNADQKVIIDKIQENTEISVSAFKEANDTNKKIEQLAGAYSKIAGRTTALESKKNESGNS